MKLKVINCLSAVCFFLSSAALLLIPALPFDDDLPIVAYSIAGTFWGALFFGIALQVFLFIKTRNRKAYRALKLQKVIAVEALLVSLVALYFVIIFFKDKLVALSITLFVLLSSIESIIVIRRMEKL